MSNPSDQKAGQHQCSEGASAELAERRDEVKQELAEAIRSTCQSQCSCISRRSSRNRADPECAPFLHHRRATGSGPEAPSTCEVIISIARPDTICRSDFQADFRKASPNPSTTGRVAGYVAGVLGVPSLGCGAPKMREGTESHSRFPCRGAPLPL